MHTEPDVHEVVKVLGLPADEHFTRVRFSDQLAQGLPIAALERVQSLVAPGAAGFTRLIVAEGTLKRRRQKRQPLSHQESQRLERVARIWTMVLDVYKHEDRARRFLTSPHPMLDGRTPLQVAVANDVGADAVEGILGRLKYGSAA